MTVLDLFTVQILIDEHTPPSHDFTFTGLAALMAETEENLTDLLPPGYRARIRRWDTNPGEDE